MNPPLSAASFSIFARDVIEAMTTNDSRFFRDSTPFEHLRDDALPHLHAVRPPDAPIRIWLAGASSGQEAYPLAMIAAEQQVPFPRRAAHILDTDIARVPLASTQPGRINDFELGRSLSPELQGRYFRRNGDR